MTDEPEGPKKTYRLTRFNLKTGYDQLWLDIGDTRYFILPELALYLADALKRNVAVLRPPIKETE